MKFTLDGLKSKGFRGFVKISDLQFQNCIQVPRTNGVYMVVRTVKSPPVFLEHSVGGQFKRNNPTVSINELECNWVKGASVLYVGKAGGKKANLYTRIRLYVEFGLGKPRAHWGGRHIWQLRDPLGLLITWKTTQCDPKETEKQLIAEFETTYGKLPFANLRRG